MNQITKYLPLFFTANLNCFNKKDLAIMPVHENEKPELKYYSTGIYSTGNPIQRNLFYYISLKF